MTGCFFFGKGFWIVQCSHHRFVAQLFHQNHGGVLVQRLVDGGHLAELHQLLDDFRGFDRHLVGQLAHGDGFRHVHFQHACFDRCLWCAVVITVAVTAAFGASTPAVAAHATTRVTAGFNGFLFGLFVSPAGRQLGAFDFLVARCGCARRSGCTRACTSAGCTGRLVQSAFDGFGIWRWLRLLSHHLLLWRAHHQANGFGFSQSFATTAVQIGSTSSVFVGTSFRGRCSFHTGGFSGLRFDVDHGLCCFGLSFRRSSLSHHSSFGLRLGFGSFLLGLLFGFLLFAQAAFFSQLFFLATDQLGLAACFFFTAGQLGMVNHGHNRLLHCSRCCLHFCALVFIAFDEGALFTHFDLDGAGFACGVSLFDLGGRFLDQGDFLALGRCSAMAGLQVAQEHLFVALCQHIAGRSFGNTGCLELVKQGVGWFFEFAGKLGYGRTGHI